MQKDEFIAYLSNPSGLDEKSLINLREILRDYPYFQAAHLLLVKNLSNLNHMKFDNQLRLSAAYVGNRQLLFRLLSESYSNPKSSFLEHDVTEEPVPKEIPGVFSLTQPGVKSEMPQEERSIADIVLEQVQEMKKSIEQPVEERKIQESSETSTSSTGEIFEIDDKQEITEADPVQNAPEGKFKTPADLLVIEDQPDSEKHESTAEESKTKVEDEREKSLQKKTSIEKEIHLYETHSFTSWLTLFREDNESLKEKSGNPQIGQRKKKNDLIETFITTQPRMEKPVMMQGEEKVEDVSQHSLMDSDDFITETLAKIYMKQKKYDKAISFYEKLSLKYPEKVSYFADQIEEIKKLLTINNS